VNACAGSNPASYVILFLLPFLFLFWKFDPASSVAVSHHSPRGRAQPERPRALRPPPSCASCFLVDYASTRPSTPGASLTCPRAVRHRRIGDGGGESKHSSPSRMAALLSVRERWRGHDDPRVTTTPGWRRRERAEVRGRRWRSPPRPSLPSPGRSRGARLILPRHRHALEPSFLESNDILRGGSNIWLSLKLHGTAQRIPQKMLTSSPKVDECKPLAAGL